MLFSFAVQGLGVDLRVDPEHPPGCARPGVPAWQVAHPLAIMNGEKKPKPNQSIAFKIIVYL